MILLQRLTSFAIAAIIGLFYGLLIYVPQTPGLLLFFLFLLVPILFARLLRFEVRTVSFWIFLGTPLFYFASSFFFFVFLEQTAIIILLALVVMIGTWLYAENLFSFYHLPSTYQAYALEYLSFVLFVVGSFFFANGAYGAQLFLQLPVWVPALAVFWVTLFATSCVFWVSKVIVQKSYQFSIVGAVLLTELYVALDTLPTSFIVNATAFAIFMYLYLGLARIHLLDHLSGPIVRRYLVVSSVLLLAVFLTAAWN